MTVFDRQHIRRQTISDALAGLTPEQVRDLVRQSLDDDKGMDIVTIPLAGKSTIADYMVIATGSSNRQVAAMADHIEFKLKQAGIAIMGKEGTQQADWVLLDTAEVIVHIFRPEVREFYALERMWTQTSSQDEVVHVSQPCRPISLPAMKLEILAIGRAKSSPENNLAKGWLSRLPYGGTLHAFESNLPSGQNARRTNQAKLQNGWINTPRPIIGWSALTRKARIPHPKRWPSRSANGAMRG